jgi:peptide/nickel transport system substrate-binding protein
VVHTWWSAADLINPAVHFGLSGAGGDAWFGWPSIPQLEKPTTDWVRATDRTKRRQLAADIQTAKALGLTIPPSLLARPDRIIE